MLPLLMLLYDLAWPSRSTWRARWPAYAALLLPLTAFLAMRAAVPTHMTIEWAENPLASAGFWTARLTAMKVIGKYLALFLWPARLSPDYSYNAVPLFAWRFEWESFQAIFATVMTLALVVLALGIRWRQRAKPAFFFLFFFFVALAPVSNLFFPIGSIMAERFLYLPSIGLAGCVVLAIRELSQRLRLRPRPKLAAQALTVSLLCLALGARTYVRNLDWRDAVSLWTSAVEVCPTAARPHNNLGNALSLIPGRLPEAIAEFESAIRIEPGYADAHYNLGSAWAQVPGRSADAIAEYETALRLDPEFVKARINLAGALARTPGRAAEAIAQYEAALGLDPADAETHYDLANLLSLIPGRLPDAIAHYRAASAMDPANAKVHSNLGSALLQMPDGLAEAIAEFQAALRLDPGYAKALNNLGNAYVRMGRFEDAIAEYEAALRSQPGLAEAHFNLGGVLAPCPGAAPTPSRNSKRFCGWAKTHRRGKC